MTVLAIEIEMRVCEVDVDAIRIVLLRINGSAEDGMRVSKHPLRPSQNVGVTCLDDHNLVIYARVSPATIEQI